MSHARTRWINQKLTIRSILPENLNLASCTLSGTRLVKEAFLYRLRGGMIWENGEVGTGPTTSIRSRCPKGKLEYGKLTRRMVKRTYTYGQRWVGYCLDNEFLSSSYARLLICS